MATARDNQDLCKLEELADKVGFRIGYHVLSDDDNFILIVGSDFTGSYCSSDEAISFMEGYIKGQLDAARTAEKLEKK
jgi:hypothetical protein